MKRKIKAGSTSMALPIFIQDTSNTTGGGLGSLVYNTTSLVAEYRRKGDSSWTAITLVTKTLGTWVSGGFIADGSLTGAYELDVPNAAIATGAVWVAIRLRGATNMLPVLIEIELDAVDYQTAQFGAMASYTQPTGFLAATFPTTVAATGDAMALTSGERTTLAAAIWNALTSSMNTAGSIGKRLIDYLTGDIFARIGAPTGASIAADIQTRLAATSYVAPDNAGISTANSGLVTLNNNLAVVDGHVLAIPTTAPLNSAATQAAAAAALTSYGAATGGQVAAVEINVRGADNDTLKTLSDQADGIHSKTTNLPANPAAVGSSMVLSGTERNAIATALLTLANGVETGVNLQQALRAMASALAGSRSNCGTVNEQYDAIGNPGTPRVVANASAAGDGTPTLTL